MPATLYATSRTPGDGVTTQFEFNFAGGYMDQAHVKAYIEDATTFARTPVTVDATMFVNASTLDLGVSAPVGSNMVIYRDTPKGQPLVDFVNGSRFTEANLDKVAKQAVFIGAETTDATNVDAIASIGLAAASAAGSALSAGASAGAASSSAGLAAASQVAAAASALEAAGYVAVIIPANFATAAQGDKADTALQPAAIGVSVQAYDQQLADVAGLTPTDNGVVIGNGTNFVVESGAALKTSLGLAIGTDVQAYDAATAKTNAAQSFTASQRAAPVTDNDLSFDLNAAQNINCTPTAGGTLTFTNIAAAAGQSGIIILVNGANYAIAAAATTKISAASLGAISATGTYKCAYYCNGTNVYVTVSENLA